MSGTITSRYISNFTNHAANKFEVAVHRGQHQRRNADFIGQVRARAGVEQPFRDLSILAQKRSEKQRAIIRSARVDVLMLAEIAIDQRGLVGLNRADEILGRNWLCRLLFKRKPDSSSDKERG